MANQAYEVGLERISNFDWAGSSVQIGVMLVANTYSFNAAHATVASVAAHEASGAGYGRQGVASGNRSTSSGSNGGLALITDGSVVWTGINAGTDLSVVLFFDDQSDLDDNTNPLLGYYDTGINIPVDTTGQDVTLNFNSLGAYRIRNVGSP